MLIQSNLQIYCQPGNSSELCMFIFTTLEDTSWWHMTDNLKESISSPNINRMCCFMYP